MRILILCVFVIIITSCKKKENEYIIPAGAFKEILIDLHLADGIYMANYGKYQAGHTDSLNFYNTIFESYGYNRAKFDSTMNYYLNNPAKLEKLYDKVVDEISLLEQQFNKLREFDNDSLQNLYKGKTRIYLPGENRYSRIPFDIPIDKDSVVYEINVFAKKYSDDQSKNLRITAYFWTKDSISKKWTRTDFPEVKYTTDKYYNMYKTSLVYAQKQKGRLRGWILNSDNPYVSSKKHVDIKMIYIEKKIRAMVK